jgi:hypothetical protein
VDDSGCYNNAGVSPAPSVIRRLLFFLYSSFKSSGFSVKESSDLENRSLDSRRLIMLNIDYITFRCRSTDYYSQRNKEIRISESKDPIRPSRLNNNVKSL